jgi:hypothetical protein
VRVVPGLSFPPAARAGSLDRRSPGAIPPSHAAPFCDPTVRGVSPSKPRLALPGLWVSIRLSMGPGFSAQLHRSRWTKPQASIPPKRSSRKHGPLRFYWLIYRWMTTRKAQERAVAACIDVLSGRIADLDWQQGRVYFLAFLNPSRGQPVPALTARLASLCHRR